MVVDATRIHLRERHVQRNIPAAQSHREMGTPEVRVLRVNVQVSPFSDREALGRAHPQPSQGSGNPWDEQGRCPVPGGGAH